MSNIFLKTISKVQYHEKLKVFVYAVASAFKAHRVNIMFGNIKM
jgi:hypothetical protein